MKSRLAQAVVLGLLVGLAGSGLLATPLGRELEEAVGLEALFHLRGPRRPPPEVLIVSIDRISAGRLGLPADSKKWPRSVHARLVDRLSGGGAAVIAFDVFFGEPRTGGEDETFSRSLLRARNVVLCGFLKRENVTAPGTEARGGGAARVVRFIPPAPMLADSAAAVAPFPLPKIPVKVSRYWAFDTQAGETPTLPVVAFHVFSPETVDAFGRLMEKGVPDRHSPPVPGIVEGIRNFRDEFERSPGCGETMIGILRGGTGHPADEEAVRKIRSLIGLYGGGNERFLNFYGPPGSIRTIPFYRFLTAGGAGDEADPSTEVRGKAVFVGLSEPSDPDMKDGHYSVYSSPDGLDVSGVEVAATAFANLLEDMPVRPLGSPAAFAAVFLFGAAAGVLCRILSPLKAAGSLGVLGAVCIAGGAYRFRAAGSWDPLVIPVLFQTSFAYAGGIFLRYLEAKRERQSIRKAFEYYLPAEVVDRLSKDAAGVGAESRMVHGICLSTDVENYTALSESLDPKGLASLMNSYYETVFTHVKRHGGIVSNVVADSMLALWVSAPPREEQVRNALLAAVDIAAGTSAGNGPKGPPPLSTRVGISAGGIALGNLGAVDHFEYRPVGDIVNTATRIEGLNKQLGTRILATDEAVRGLGGILTREVGTFLLAGKARPVRVHEVACRSTISPDPREDAFERFAAGLAAFRRRSWAEAIEKFREAAGISGGDGPSAFYTGLCERYMAEPPPEGWDGTVTVRTK